MAAIQQLSNIYSRITSTLQNNSTNNDSQHNTPQKSNLVNKNTVPFPKLPPQNHLNIIEDDNGDLPTITYKVHTGTNLIPPDDPPSPPRVNTPPPPRVIDGPSTNLRSRFTGGTASHYALATATLTSMEANSVIHPDTGVAQEYRHLLKGPDKTL